MTLVVLAKTPGPSIRELPPHYLAELLELIALQRPAVIFLDFEVERARQRTTLLNVVQKLQPRGDEGTARNQLHVPIYIARGDEDVPLDGEARMTSAHRRHRTRPTASGDLRWP